MNAQVLHGDCLDVLRGMADDSVDSIVTDPPYGLSFMGKRWDYDVPSVEIWAECLRVLKPGGHLLAFAGTRTQHRMAVRIEDAGFQIIDLIAWVHGQGFPKSHNIDRYRGEKICGCSDHALEYSHERASPKDLRVLRQDLAADNTISGGTQQDVFAGMRGPDDFGTEGRKDETDRGAEGGAFDLPGLRAGIHEAVSLGQEGCDAGLQSEVQRRFEVASVDHAGVSAHGSARTKPGAAGGEQSCMEGRRNSAASQGQLCSSSIHQGTGMGATDGAQGWVSDGTSGRDGEGLRIPADADGVRAPSGSQPAEQSTGQLGTVAGQQVAQDGRAWPMCRRCNLPVVPAGLGTALKPALEPITVARKPLAGTVAQNVLEWGTGAINVDGCRVGYASADDKPSPVYGGRKGEANGGKYGNSGDYLSKVSDAGRWPANLIHDGSDEVTGLFPQSKAGTETQPRGKGGIWSPSTGTPAGPQYGDTGSAARFFYCAKASKRDRDEGLDLQPDRVLAMSNQAKAELARGNMHDGDSGMNTAKLRKNNHPTVKPTDLMRYLCRLVTPPGGLVLDPFTGSGSTGKGAVLEGFRFVGIEREAEYVEIARARIAAVTPDPEPAPEADNDNRPDDLLSWAGI